MKKITKKMLSVAMWALACPGAALAMDFANLQQPASLAIDGVAAAESVTVGSDGWVRVQRAQPFSWVTLTWKVDLGAATKVIGGECKYTLSAVNADEFPVMSAPKNGSGFDLAANVVKEMLRKVEYAAGNDSARKVLQGVNVCTTGKMIRMVATDGKRLSMVECFFDRGGAKEVSLGTLPREVVKELSSLLGKMELGKDVKITTDGKTVSVSAESGEFEIMAKLYEDVYPNWTKVVPAKVAFTAKAKREAFLQELWRAEASTLAGDGRNVKLTFEKNRVIMEGAANDISKSRTQMEVEYDGEKAQFVVNPRLIEDVLKSIDDEEVTIGFDGSDQRLVIKCTVPFVAVIQPMRVS